ncbi:unnamed protein product [Prorocentrum cordatum]|uniref:C2 domain-containing protein n=1 Tax=Prorocentrum cordatum TaxID=2364126 RepID=A0ABN9V5V0_9DINO|nr:unnamed protein product [Polarella glacialis]
MEPLLAAGRPRAGPRTSEAGGYGVPNTEFKTDTIKKETSARELNPVWNFKQPMPDAAPGCTIEFEVFDWDRFTKDDPLGKAKLEMSQEPCSPDESFEAIAT